MVPLLAKFIGKPPFLVCERTTNVMNKLLPFLLPHSIVQSSRGARFSNLVYVNNNTRFPRVVASSCRLGLLVVTDEKGNSVACDDRPASESSMSAC